MLCNSLGNGIFLTISTIYFINILNISTWIYSFILLLGGLLGLFSGTFFGHLADKVGSKPIYCLSLLIQGICCIGYLFGGNIGIFIACLIGSIIFEKGASAARGAMMVEIVSREERVKFRALTRVIVNGAACIGAALGSIVLILNAESVFLIAILFNGLTFVATSFIFKCMSIKGKKPVEQIILTNDSISQNTSVLTALSDKRFLIITLLNSVLALHSSIINIAIPIWISQYSQLPIWLVSAVILINTIGVILFQVKVGENVKSIRDATKVAQKAGFLLAITCIFIGMSNTVPIWAGIIMILLAGISQLFGELYQAVSGWTFSFELAPEDAYGKYQGIFNAGKDASLLVSPLIFTSLVLPAGLLGWGALTILFILTALCTDRLVYSNKLLKG
ncbi:MFS transporter [Lysinibacillus sphaericus]|uniref:MFS transporter n=2 Tax=Lysinibacillus TaxID=400634 RepID=A0A2S0K0K2_LYSSH|nr:MULTISPECIES: MFS transporter [Lysinibacillus]AVK96829.1 hypothetical protein LS41612_11440 [Lysinibacillus sphaericus]MED4545702.1 MFS transporter [Lysinibacillus sphaericus]TKI16731.1 MFS transporter [Lysinibacillus sphaericus]